MDQDTKSQNLKILLVENSKTARLALTQQLSQAGFRIESVSNGLEAIEQIKTKHFDVAILDVFMPQMNGYEAAKAIRALPDNRGQLTLIALTASQDPNDYNLCIDAGMDEFIIKTEKNEDLIETLTRHQEERG
ncbi:MAG: response regulator [Gammaproteobacteria bacterium]